MVTETAILQAPWKDLLHMSHPCHILDLPSPTLILQGQLQSVLYLGQLSTSEPLDLVQLY
jgi:hypothetical protein